MAKEMIAMLLAGGQGSRLYALTQRLAKPAVPFGGKYRIIDFPLSNCVNSGIDTVGILTQYQPMVLNEYIATGILLDAIVSAPLLVQIFEHNLPLHDGAVVIRGNRITAATCYLPLSENKTISKELGTRHRAGLGISEVTDALTVIVSEETGQVSLTKDGQLYRNVNSDKLRELLGGTKSSEKTQTVWDRLRKGRKRHEK